MTTTTSQISPDNPALQTKPGYKHTRIGFIPKDWNLVKLGDLSKKVTVGIASSATHAYRNRGVVLLRNQNIKPGYLDDSEVLYVTNEYDEQYKSKRLKAGDLLTVRTGYPGVTCLVPDRYDGAQSFTTLITRLKNKELGPYLTYYINSDYGIKFFTGAQIGGGQKNVGAKTLINLKIPLPPLPEQKRIASLLTTWDRAITTTQALIKQLETRKRGLMQRLLTGEVRLPGFSSAAASGGEGEWDTIQMKKIFEEITDKNDGGPHEPMTVSSTLGLVSQREKFDKVIAGKSLEKYTLLKMGDFTYNKGNSKTYPMGCIFTLEEFTSAVVPFVYISFRPKKEINRFYYSYFFENHGLDRQLKGIISSGARGDGLLNVNKKDFFNLEVPHPPLAVQNAIADILRAADEEIRIYRKQLKQLKRQKRGLMQQLLTGQKRLLA